MRVTAAPSVVIVDDQSIGRKLLARLVDAAVAGVRLRAYAEPLAALEAVRADPPDLLLTDYKMPGLDGLTIIRRMRMLPGCANTPALLVTAAEGPALRREALEAGATEVLTKPFDVEGARRRCRALLATAQEPGGGVPHPAWSHGRRDDPAGHQVEHMARCAGLIAEELGLPAHQCRLIENAIPLHDVGKAALLDPILAKPGPLTARELELIQRHTIVGYELLRDSASPDRRLGAEMALAHHERHDGKGYPRGLRGEAIPVSARIAALVDVLDAMTSRRPHREARSIEQAAAYAWRQRGAQFHPGCVDALLARLQEVIEIYDRPVQTPAPRAR